MNTKNKTVKITRAISRGSLVVRAKGCYLTSTNILHLAVLVKLLRSPVLISLQYFIFHTNLCNTICTDIITKQL